MALRTWPPVVTVAPRRRFAAALPPRAAHAVALLPALLAGAGFLWFVGAFVTDDAAITLRYSVNLAQGNGLRWNADVAHPVEGYTNFLHVLLGAACWRLHLPALSTLRALNQACAFAVCALTYALAWRALGSRAWAGAAALLVGVHGPLWYWASSGLETGVYLAASYGALYAFLHAAPGSWTPLLPFALAALARFEGPVVFASCGLAALLAALRERAWTPLTAHARWALPFALGYGAYFAFRLHYFDHLLPNSAYYKRGELDSELLREFARHCWPLLALACAAPWLSLGRLGVALFGLLVAHALGFLGVAQSVAYFHRFFLPVVPGLAILAAAALQRLATVRVLGSLLAMRVLAVALLAGALGSDLLKTHNGGARAVIGAVASLDSRIEARAEVAAFVARHFSPRARVAIEDVGVVGYVLPNPVFDLLGLNDEAFTHQVYKQRAYHALNALIAKPEVIALVSKRADSFSAQYGAGGLITRFAGFSRKYRHVRTISASADSYHVFLFARSDQQEPPALPVIVLDRRRSLAASVDALAREVRTR
jgi:hypothetical protein